MTPPDGGEHAFAAAGEALLAATQAILLHGGRALVLFEDVGAAPPRCGELVQAGSTLIWKAECWRMDDAAGERWCGLAVLDALPAGDGELRCKDDPRRWRFQSAPSVDIAPQPLAELVRKAGVDGRAVFDFLVRHLIAGRPEDTAEALAHHAFARGFFTAAAEPDGFIEILAQPDCGGMFAQGWSLSLPSGPATLAILSGDLAVHEVEVAQFERHDILPPGRGICLYGKDWSEAIAAQIDAVFFEEDGRLLRLDVVTTAVTRFDGAAATGHVAHMAPRLAGPDETLRNFRRICRPRFAGDDTLSGARAPVAAGFDAVLQAPDGGMLVIGWLLDPLRRVRLALVKSTAHLYAPMQHAWIRLPRPDLCAGFAADPRFAGLLDPNDALYGFFVHLPAARERTEGADSYIELVLDDETCLFRPLSVTPFTSAERLPQILATLSPTEPELGRIVEDHLTPFLRGVPPKAIAQPHAAGARPIALGAQGPARAVSAIMPVGSLAELQPVLALLAGTPDAAALDLVLVAPRIAAAEMVKPVAEAFRFYDLRGALVICSDRDTLGARLDAGVAATQGAKLLAWLPSALPKAAGWLGRLVAEADAIGEPGLLSPAMTYEDGSVCFGGVDRGAGADTGARPVCAVAGYGQNWLALGAPVPLAAGAAEIALIDRALLLKAGGFAGHLFSDAFAQVDLADRLRRIGAAAWCSGSVEFWMLEDQLLPEPDLFCRLMQQVDAGLLLRRRLDTSGDPTP